MSQSADLQNRLLLAVRENNFDTAEQLLREKADVNIIPENSSPLIHIAVQNESKKMCQLLLDSGANPNLCNHEDVSPLHFSVMHRNYEISELLLRYSADVNKMTIHKCAPIQIAVLTQDKEISGLLLNFGASPNVLDQNREAPLHIATNLNNYEIVELLMNNRADINLMAQDGTAPIHIAIQNRHEKLCNLLLKFRPNLHILNRHGEFPLQTALKLNCYKIAEALLRNGANINMLVKDNITLIYLSALYGNDRMFQWLVDHKAEVDINMVRENKTILEHAVEKQSIKMIKYVLKHCSAKRENFPNLLHSAILVNFNSYILGIFLGKIKPGFGRSENTLSDGKIMRYLKIIQCLVDHGFQISKDDIHNDKIITFVTVHHGCVKIFERLLRYGLDVNRSIKLVTFISNQEVFKMKDGGGNRWDRETFWDQVWRAGGGKFFWPILDCSILHIAVKCRNKEVIKLLLAKESGASRMICKNDIPLYYALQNGDSDILRLLLPKVDVNHYSKSFNLAVWQGNVEVVNSFLQHGYNLEKDIERPALYYTVDKGDLDYNENDQPESTDRARAEVAELLLSRMTDKNSDLKNGVMLVAVKNNCPKIVEVLSQRRVSVNRIYTIHIKNISTCNCLNSICPLSIHSYENKSQLPHRFILYNHLLHIAAENKSTDIIKLLLKSGAFVDCRNHQGLTPLFIATSKGHLETVEILLQYGANIDFKDDGGRTSLHISVSNNNIKMTNILLNYGANTMSKDVDEITPILLSIHEKGAEMFKLLLEYSLNVESDSTSDVTLLDYIDKKRTKHFGGYYQDVFFQRVMTEILQRHIMKLKIGNLPIDEAFKNLNTDLVTLEFQERCQLEIAMMRSEFINESSISYYDVLTKSLTCLLPYSRNEEVQAVIKAGFWKDKYRIYQGFISSKLTQTEKRRKLLDENEVEAFFRGTLPRLPDLCLEKIISFFTNEDLVALIRYFYRPNPE